MLEIPDATLITVARAVAESRLGPKHAELQEWSLLAAFLAEQALALERGDDGGVFATDRADSECGGASAGVARRWRRGSAKCAR